jgi:hypothetical protein
MEAFMGKDAPEAPDPAEVARAQSAANIKTAQEQARLAMTGQVTPFGSVQYVKDPTSPSGFRAITQLSPEQQALLAQGQDLQAQYGGIAGEQLGRVGDVMATPFDLQAGRGREISDIQQTFLDPQWDQQKRSLEADLLNRGIRPGSEAYETQMRQFGQQRDDSYNKMFLDAWQLANNAALTERNIPLTDLAALGGGAFPQGTQPVGGAPTPSPGVAPTDVAGPIYQNYNAQMSQYNQGMGGLFGMGASALGGWAQAGFPGVASGLAMLSDRRAKTDIRKLGDDPRGWGVYLFRYIWDGIEQAVRIGFMADEIEKHRPDAVGIDPETGFKIVDYGALALA